MLNPTKGRKKGRKSEKFEKVREKRHNKQHTNCATAGEEILGAPKPRATGGNFTQRKFPVAQAEAKKLRRDQAKKVPEKILITNALQF